MHFMFIKLLKWGRVGTYFSFLIKVKLEFFNLIWALCNLLVLLYFTLFYCFVGQS